jgi:hypothetical protein
MPERQIAFASTWFYKDGQHIVARRGEIHEIPQNEFDRLEKLGALVPEGGELERPGQLIPLLANASGEHIRNYLSSGSTAEILAHVPDYPTALVDRLAAAERTGQERTDLLDGLTRYLRPENELAEVRVDSSGPMLDENGVTTSATLIGRSIADNSTVEDNAGGVPTSADGEDLVEFVSTNTVEAVLERAGDDPDTAAALRAAEESRGEKARKGAIEGLTKIENPEG